MCNEVPQDILCAIIHNKPWKIEPTFDLVVLNHRCVTSTSLESDAGFNELRCWFEAATVIFFLFASLVGTGARFRVFSCLGEAGSVHLVQNVRELQGSTSIRRLLRLRRRFM